MTTKHPTTESMADNINETTPLLSGNPATTEAIHNTDAAPIPQSSLMNSETSSTTAVATPPNRDNTQTAKPLPIAQMLLLCFDRIVEPIAFFSIFPFINQMCVRNGNLDPADTGFYSGLIESLFSLTQMLVMIIWGRLSDRYGRKPILVVSLFGIAFATALFGLAQTIWQMILFRCIAGVFAGTIVTIRTMISEHSTAKTQARAFSWFAFSGNLGIMLGPLIGGALADPAKQYGGVFRRAAFFKHYPYALATCATGSIASIAAVVTLFYAEETLQGHKTKKAEHDDPEFETSLPKVEGDMSTWDLLKAPGVRPVLYLYSHIMILAFSFTAILPVFLFEPASLGGFGFSSLYISIFMGLTGASQACWLLLVFPPLQHRIGTGGVLRVCAYVYPFFFLACPLLNALLRDGSHAAERVFWVVAPITLCLGVGVSMSFTAIQLALNDVSPSPRTLSTLNALALTLVSGLRAFAPVAFTSLVAVGVRRQILKGYLVWAVMIALAVGFSIAVQWMPAKAEGNVDQQKAGGDEAREAAAARY